MLGAISVLTGQQLPTGGQHGVSTYSWWSQVSRAASNLLLICFEITLFYIYCVCTCVHIHAPVCVRRSGDKLWHLLISSSPWIFKTHFVYVYDICVYVWVQGYHGTHVEIRGQPWMMVFLLLCLRQSPCCIVAVYSMLTGLRAFRGPFVSTSHFPEEVLGLPVLPDAPVQFYMGSEYLNSDL